MFADSALPASSPPPCLKPVHTTLPRTEPDNIYEFGAQYFTALLQQGQEGGDEGPSTSGLGLGNVASAALGMDISKLSAAELEPIVLREC